MECPFCAIVAGRQPCLRVMEDGEVVAFLDRRPLFPGHVLVIPRRHAQTLTDLTAQETGPFFLRVRRLAGAVERGMAAAGTFVAVNNRVSQSVPHLHVHIVPRERRDGLRGFFWPRHPYPDEEHARRAAARVRAALDSPPGPDG
ncbi:HIT family protein [Streptomyces sodiiphilus]|uniref:HIT family protein n=1 Tax=Streptomyces sodiiphilus TaxID=226217 RepID=A0ABN2P4L0_9ACTN